jgi:Tol biopolymer transport system component
MPSIEGTTHGRSRFLALAAVPLFALGISLVVSTPADAAFPGGNGAIAFTRFWHVWTVQPDGTQTKLASGRDPAWSPDGTRIAYIHDNGLATNIWTMAADGSDKTQLTSANVFRSDPAWSPDGTRIVFSDNQDLFVIDAVTPFADPVRITHTADAEEADPKWSPDGTAIAFDVLDCPTPEFCGTRIGVVAPDGDAYTLLTAAIGAVEFEPDWSPDSTTLLFDSNRHADPGDPFDFDVYSVAASGGTVTRVLRAAGDRENISPAWSPDGTRFVYVHETLAGTLSIKTAAADGTSSVRVCRAWIDLYSVGPDWQPT